MHWHRWSKWTDITLDRLLMSWAGAPTPTTVLGQERRCAKCGKRQIREVEEP